MSTLSSYIAKNYLSASTPSSSLHNDPDRPPKKRRKRDNKHIAAEQNTLIIADDDDDLQISRSTSTKVGEDQDGLPMMMIDQSQGKGKARSAEFRKKKMSGWNVVMGEGEEEADRILKEAAEQDVERRREVEMEDAPEIVRLEGEGDEGGVGVKMMESGVRAGLQTAEDTKRLMEKEEKERRTEEKRRRKERKTEVEVVVAVEEETIYRDASGRRIDVNAKRLEAKRKEREEEERKKREKEDAMGEVQRRQKEGRKQDLEDAKFMTLARGEDDEVMNEQLKEVVRWDDPMAQYMAQKKAEEVSRGGEARVVGASVGAKSKGKVYQGHAPPNRYGIQPGWRWDGVDRGNGFEKEWFQARSKKARNAELSYQWQEDE